MVSFEVSDMTCGHCVSTITKAVKAADPLAKVSVDLATRTVGIESAEDPAELQDAIRGAGYTPVAKPGTGVPPSPARGGCCRG